jgi:hypothetical protein
MVRELYDWLKVAERCFLSSNSMHCSSAKWVLQPTAFTASCSPCKHCHVIGSWIANCTLDEVVDEVQFMVNTPEGQIITKLYISKQYRMPSSLLLNQRYMTKVNYSNTTSLAASHYISIKFNSTKYLVKPTTYFCWVSGQMRHYKRALSVCNIIIIYAI